MMEGQECHRMQPWYKGFAGRLVPNSDTGGKGYSCVGAWEELDDTTLEITELPIGKWIRDYKADPLEKLMEDDNAVVADIEEHHIENRVKFVVTVPKLQEIKA